MTFVEEAYHRTARLFQDLLDNTAGGLPPKIEILWNEHAANGFVQDDLSQSQRYRICSDESVQCLVVQHNPKRAERKHPVRVPRLLDRLAGRRLSRLDLDMIPHASGYRQFPYKVQLNGREYALLANPYPFARFHLTVASTLESDPQGWRGSPDRLSRILADLCELVRQAPGFLGIYNSLAGATVLDRNHFQLLAHEPNPWPLEEALAGGGDRVCVTDPAHYPLSAWRFTGDLVDAVRQAVEVTVTAREIAGDVAAENYLACARNGVVSLYYVPRDSRHIAARPGFLIGSLETFGEMISEGERMEEFFFSYESLSGMLRSVRPYFAEELARRCA